MSQSNTQATQGCFALVGGPGQGKSTLSQFLCQIQRANLLGGKTRIDTEVQDVVSSIRDHCVLQNLPIETARRFPMRLELARFAKALSSSSESGVSSVLSYVAHLIKERTDYDIVIDDLRKWLEEYPWLVILDGLDEVPASSNRDEVIAAVRDFLIDIAMCNGDVLVLATTRPQGYNEDLSPQRYQHRWLTPLSVARALHYGKSLVELTYKHNEQRKREVLNRLKKAVKTPSTARLMESPLQVTIMARLLSQVAQPPQERYRLFQQYYKVIYRREMERGVQVLSPLLRDHEANVDAIHHRTGLLLQIESEKARHTDAMITLDEFRSVVVDRLREEGFSGDSLDNLTDEMTTCATDRLVFLVPSQSDRVGFEIRSLQEFMAAEALMDSSDDLVVERLRAIAPVPFWQNVLLFASGKCFAERQWLRHSVSQICGELNDDPQDNLAHYTLAGSRMAISLLEDGPAQRQPAYAQALTRTALALLALPEEGVHDRIADVYDPSLEMVYREELSRHLHGNDSNLNLAAWRVLSTLAGRGIAWAISIGDKSWPDTANDIMRLLDGLSHRFRDNPWLMEKYADSFFDCDPILLFEVFDNEKNAEPFFKGNPLVAHAFHLMKRHIGIGARTHRFTSIRCFGVGPFGPLSIEMGTLSESRECLSAFVDLRPSHDYWLLIRQSALFSIEPSSENLAEVLDVIAGAIRLPLLSSFRLGLLLSSMIPWPLLACLMEANSANEMRALASQVRRGMMGGHDDWLRAEARWKSQGITKYDLEYMTDGRWPIPKDIGRIGFPFVCFLLFRREVRGLEKGKTEDLEAIWENIPGTRAKNIFAQFIIDSLLRENLLFLGHIKSAPVNIPPRLIYDMICRVDQVHYSFNEALSAIYTIVRDSPYASKTLEKMGRLATSHYYRFAMADMLSDIIERLTKWIENEDCSEGHILLLVDIAQNTKIKYLLVVLT